MLAGDTYLGKNKRRMSGLIEAREEGGSAREKKQMMQINKKF